MNSPGPHTVRISCLIRRNTGSLQLPGGTAADRRGIRLFFISTGFLFLLTGERVCGDRCRISGRIRLTGPAVSPENTHAGPATYPHVRRKNTPRES